MLKRFYISKLRGFPIDPAASSGGGKRPMATQLLVHDRYYNHETVWSSGLVTNYHLWRFEKLAKTIVRELNKNDGEGELSPKTQRRINEIYYRRNRSK